MYLMYTWNSKDNQFSMDENIETSIYHDMRYMVQHPIDNRPILSMDCWPSGSWYKSSRLKIFKICNFQTRPQKYQQDLALGPWGFVFTLHKPNHEFLFVLADLKHPKMHQSRSFLLQEFNCGTVQGVQV